MRLNLLDTLQASAVHQVDVYAKNLFDELAVYDGIGTFQDPESIIAARPRTFGINGRYRF